MSFIYLFKVLLILRFLLFIIFFGSPRQVFDLRGGAGELQPCARLPNMTKNVGAAAPIAGLAASADGKRLLSSAAAFWDEADEDDGPDCCVQVRIRRLDRLFS